MEREITWYDVLGVLPGAEAAKIRHEYDAKKDLLRPALISGAPSNVLQGISRAQGILDNAWEVLGDPASRRTQAPPRAGGSCARSRPRTR